MVVCTIADETQYIPMYTFGQALGRLCVRTWPYGRRLGHTPGKWGARHGKEA